MGRPDPAEELLPSPTGGDGQMKKRAYANLKRLLVSRSVAPSTFLSVRQLARQLEMSSTPVRAALERLEAEGFITISPQQGIVVREPSIQEIIDHYEAREALESYAVRKLAGHLTAEQSARLHVNLDAQRSSLDAADLERNVALDTEFHALFCEFLGNDQIIRMILQLRDKIHRTIVSIAHRDPSRMADSYQEHLGIADAVIAGEGERAATLVVEHLEAGKQCILSPRRFIHGA